MKNAFEKSSLKLKSCLPYISMLPVMLFSSLSVFAQDLDLEDKSQALDAANEIMQDETFSNAITLFRAIIIIAGLIAFLVIIFRAISKVYRKHDDRETDEDSKDMNILKDTLIKVGVLAALVLLGYGATLFTSLLSSLG